MVSFIQYILILCLLCLSASLAQEVDQGTPCQGTWKHRDGNYNATWTFSDETDAISFTIQSRQPQNKWTAIGFSSQQSLENADVVLGWLPVDGSPYIVDGHIKGETVLSQDLMQNLRHGSKTASYQDGVLTLGFSRRRNTNDPNDKKFSAEECYYFIFWTQGGTYADTTKPLQLSSSERFITQKKICISSCLQDSNEKLEYIMDAYVVWRFETAPEHATYYGYHSWDDTLEQLTEMAFLEQYNRASQFAYSLENDIVVSELNKENRINFVVLQHQLEAFMDGYSYRQYGYTAFNTLFDPLDDTFIFYYMLYETLDDYEKVLARMDAYATKIYQQKALMQDAVRNERTLHSIVFSGVLESWNKSLQIPPNESSWYSPFTNFNSNWSMEVRLNITSRALDIIENRLYPALKDVYDFIIKEYLPKSRSGVGYGSLGPGGAAYYQACLRWHLSLDVTPQEVHDIGWQEYVRIKKKIEKIRDKDGFKGTLPEYIRHLQKQPSYFYNNAEEIVQDFEQYIEAAQASLPKILKDPPTSPIVVEVFADQYGPPAYYSPGPYDGSIPSAFYMNTFAPNETARMDSANIVTHEAIPGHHTQFSYELLLDLPLFRRAMDWRRAHLIPFNWPSFTAYSEGWALYAEFLGEEMDLYDKYDTLGLYYAELWRAARLIIDTGIHAFNWTAEESINLMVNSTILPYSQCVSEVYRYISWPGQACAYKMGEIVIMRLRNKAEDLLGSSFDVREFHAEVLGVGNVPMSLLEEELNMWMNKKALLLAGGATALTSLPPIWLLTSALVLLY